MIMKPLPLRITREDEEIIFTYKYPGKRGRVMFSPDMLELAIIRAEISTSIIIKDIIRGNRK